GVQTCALPIFASVSLSILVGIHTASTERVVHDWTGRLLQQPFGRATVGAIGVAIIVGGICTAIASIRAEFRNRIALEEKPRKLVTALGRVGYLTRACVIALIGVF